MRERHLAYYVKHNVCQMGGSARKPSKCRCRARGDVERRNGSPLGRVVSDETFEQTLE